MFVCARARVWVCACVRLCLSLSVSRCLSASLSFVPLSLSLISLPYLAPNVSWRNGPCQPASSKACEVWPAQWFRASCDEARIVSWHRCSDPACYGAKPASPQTHRHKDTKTQRHKDTKTQRQTHVGHGKSTGASTGTQARRHARRHTGTQARRHTGTRAHRHTGTHAGTQAHRHCAVLLIAVITGPHTPQEALGKHC